MDVTWRLLFPARLSPASTLFPKLLPSNAWFTRRLSAFMTCWKPCPSSHQDAVVRQVTGLFETQCSPSVSQEQRESKSFAIVYVRHFVNSSSILLFAMLSSTSSSPYLRATRKEKSFSIFHLKFMFKGGIDDS